MRFIFLLNFLCRHATLLYDNEQLASNAIQHVDQYKINGQQLTVSLFRHKKFSSTH